MENKKILIVEDEVLIARNIAAELENSGYEIIDTVNSGYMAIEAALKIKPDLILMDIVIKGDMDGIETSMELNKKIDVPIVFLTAYSDNDTVNRVKDVAPYGYILKPFRKRELNIIVEMALVRHDFEVRLRESEERYSRLVNSSPLGIASIDENWNFVKFNPVHVSIFGLGPEENVREINLKKYRPFKDSGILTDLIDVFDSSETAVNEYLYITEKGRPAEIRCHMTPISDNDGASCGVLLITEDVTEVKQIESELYENEEKLAVAQAGLNLGLFDWDIKSGDVFYDHRLVDSLGYSLNEMKPDIETFKNLLHPEEKKRVLGLIADHHSGKADMFVAELRLKMKSGDWKSVISSGMVVKWDDKKRPLRMICVNMDLSDYSNKKELCGREHEKFELLFNSIPFPSIVWKVEKGEFILVKGNDLLREISLGEIDNFKGIKASVFYKDQKDIIKVMEECFRSRSNIKKESAIGCRFNKEIKFSSINCIYLGEDSFLVYFEMKNAY